MPPPTKARSPKASQWSSAAISPADHSPAAVHHLAGGLDRGSGHHLGLRAHNEHAGTADELGAPQPHATDDVLEGLTALSAQHQRVIGGREVAVGAVGQQQGTPQQVLGQDAGIDLRTGHAGRSQPTRRLTHQRPQPVAVHRARRRADPDPGIRVRQATPLASEAAGRVGP